MSDLPPHVRHHFPQGVWVDTGESTSAKLRRVEAELGSALSALTSMEQERDDLRALVAVLAGPHDGECAWRGLAVKVMREQQYTRAQLDDLIARPADCSRCLRGGR